MRRRRSPRDTLTREQHFALGLELVTLRDRMLGLECELGRRYGLASPLSRTCRRIMDAVDTLRSHAENQAFTDGVGEIRMYYPDRARAPAINGSVLPGHRLRLVKP